MSATDELRRMLDERGVEWTAPNSCLRDEMTSWTAGGFYYEAFEVPEPDGTFLLAATHQDDLTPEQAIAATLGTGECEWTLEHSGTLYDKWKCNACGYLYVESRTDGGATDFDPNYCPKCGARVTKSDQYL